ncbi:MAG: hypothetical protein KDB79_09600 [Acidobacteria bacterium]|nr:hypothetical protein [Acidobacteriota bacterium]
MSGYRDKIENATKSYVRHSEYKSADRAFNNDYGNLTDYRDGYQQGFESGYDTGFEKRSFDATLPSNLKSRGLIDVSTPADGATNTIKTKTKETVDKGSIPVEKNVAVTPDDSADIINTNTGPTDTVTKPAPMISARTDVARSGFSGDEIIIIPANTELVIELLNEIDTKRVREGDTFSAKIVSPVEIGGAIIEGRIAKNSRPGRIKRRAELLLSFDRIKLSDDRWSNFNALIVEILPMKGDNIKRIDNEGVVEGTRPYKDDGIKIGASAGTGLIIGAVVGGPVGAAVGAGVGAAFGVGAVVVERGEYIKLQQDQQIRIKTAYETQIR